MTLEDRIVRIEAALIAAGLIVPESTPTEEQAIADLLKGDTTTLKAFFIRQIKQGRAA